MYQGGTQQLRIISYYSQSAIVKDKVASSKQVLNTTTPTKVVKLSLAVIDMKTLIEINSPSSERVKEKYCEVISPDYCIPEFQDMLKVYGENEVLKVTSEYLSVSFGRFSQFFAIMCKRTGGLFLRHHIPLRELFQIDACAYV